MLIYLYYETWVLSHKPWMLAQAEKLKIWYLLFIYISIQVANPFSSQYLRKYGKYISLNKRSVEEMERGCVQENDDVTSESSTATAVSATIPSFLANQKTVAVSESSAATSVSAFIDVISAQEITSTAVSQ